jgi:hypothetical protein
MILTATSQRKFKMNTLTTLSNNEVLGEIQAAIAEHGTAKIWNDARIYINPNGKNYKSRGDVTSSLYFDLRKGQLVDDWGKGNFSESYGESFRACIRNIKALISGE